LILSVTIGVEIVNLRLTDRVAFVAGSSRGIGKAIAKALLREGCRVCITGRDLAALEDTRQSLQLEFGDRVHCVAGDLTDVSAIDGALQSIQRLWGGLDILIANLGSGRGIPGWDQALGEWDRLFNQNFFGSVRLAQASIPYLKSRGGNILFIASIVAFEVTPAPLPYSAAKAALVNYSKNLSRAVAPVGIRVNCIAPGNVLFPGGSWEQHLQKRRDEVEKYIASEVPQQRFGTPEEIADLAAFMVSPVSSFATGQCYIIDGGQTRRV
jgi:3-oxoacyl-[acyl-carrier protein] reductase